MAAAVLKPDLFTHLLATQPKHPDKGTLAATLASVALHGSIAAAVLWASQRITENPAASISDDEPIVLITRAAPPEPVGPAAPPSGGGNDAIFLKPLPVPGPPVVGMPPVDAKPPGDFASPETPVRTGPARPGTPGDGRAGELAPGVFSVAAVMPVLLNGAEIRQELKRRYPPLLRDARIGGRTELLVLISEEGRVLDVRIEKSSGHAALDQAALDAAPLMRFSPAMNRDQRVKVLAQIPLDFRTD